MAGGSGQPGSGEVLLLPAQPARGLLLEAALQSGFAPRIFLDWWESQKRVTENTLPCARKRWSLDGAGRRGRTPPKVCREHWRRGKGSRGGSSKAGTAFAPVCAPVRSLHPPGGRAGARGPALGGPGAGGPAEGRGQCGQVQPCPPHASPRSLRAQQGCSAGHQPQRRYGFDLFLTSGTFTAAFSSRGTDCCLFTRGTPSSSSSEANPGHCGRQADVQLQKLHFFVSLAGSRSRGHSLAKAMAGGSESCLGARSKREALRASSGSSGGGAAPHGESLGSLGAALTLTSVRC